MQLLAGRQRPDWPELHGHRTALLQWHCLLLGQPGLHRKRLLPTDRDLSGEHLWQHLRRLWRDDQLRHVRGPNLQDSGLHQQHLQLHKPAQRATRDELHRRPDLLQQLLLR